MSSIRWSALCFSLLAPLSCAPHYDVGDAAGGSGAGGTDASGGTGNESSGGTSVSGGSNGKGTATGGMTTTGGTGGTGEGGGDPTGGTGGSFSAGTGGTPSGGTGSVDPVPPPCGAPLEVEYESLPPPDEAWEKVSRLLFGEVREPPSALPEETTPEWLVEILGAALERARQTSAVSGIALVPFMRTFLVEPEPLPGMDTPALHWSRMVSGEGARLGVLFQGDQTSNPPFGVFGTIAAAIDGLSARGAFLNSRLFCRNISLPPFEIEPVTVGPNQTRRDALAAATSEPTCLGCHTTLDPIAYPLEVLAPGTAEYRTTENGLPIDTSGVVSGDRESFEFADLQSLGGQLSVSCEVARCFTIQLFNHVAPQDSSAYTEPELERALYAFAAPDATTVERFRFQALLEAVVTSPTFLR